MYIGLSLLLTTSFIILTFYLLFLAAGLEKKSVRELAAGLNRLGNLKFLKLVVYF